MILTALDLVSLLPGFLREDVFSQAVCRALEPLLSQIVTDLDLLNTYTSVDRQPDGVLDQLAVGWGVSWYNGEDTIDAKRRIIRDALRVFGRLGTVSSLTDALAANFGDASVDEWWDYDGDIAQLTNAYLYDTASNQWKSLSGESYVADMQNALNILGVN